MEHTVTYNADLDTIEIQAFGFIAMLRKVVKVHPVTKQYYDEYSVSFNTPVLALSQKSLNEYIDFLMFVEYYVQGLNA